MDVKKQIIIFFVGLFCMLLLGIFGASRSSSEFKESQIEISHAQSNKNNNSGCDSATQFTPHGPYVSPVAERQD